jgi:hypothetical protein
VSGLTSNCRAIAAAEVPLGGILEERRRRCRSGEMPKSLPANSSEILVGNPSTRGPASNRPSVTGQTQLEEDGMIQIGMVDAKLERGDWRLTKGKNAGVQSDRIRSPGCGDAPAATANEEKDPIRIQALTDDSFRKVCIDSGAGESVCPVEAFPSYKTTRTAKTGATYRAAGGQRLANVGEIRPNFKSSGVGGSMAFQATTDVQKPLAAASKIAAKGNRIVLEADGLDSYIENKQSGKRIPLTIENGVYMMEMLVVPFPGPTK